MPHGVFQIIIIIIIFKRPDLKQRFLAIVKRAKKQKLK